MIVPRTANTIVPGGLTTIYVGPNGEQYGFMVRAAPDSDKVNIVVIEQVDRNTNRWNEMGVILKDVSMESIAAAGAGRWEVDVLQPAMENWIRVRYCQDSAPGVNPNLKDVDAAVQRTHPRDAGWICANEP